MSFGGEDGEQFSLQWNNFHSNITAAFHELLEKEDLVDVTLACDGQFLQAHKIVLSVCSPYFMSLFKMNPCKHPIVILRDVSHQEMNAILYFMYHGEVNVRQDDLSGFLKVAEMLKIKGLTGNDTPQQDTQKRKLPTEKPVVPIPSTSHQQNATPVSPAPAKKMRPAIKSSPQPEVKTRRSSMEFFDPSKVKQEPIELNIGDSCSSDGPSKGIMEDVSSVHNNMSSESTNDSIIGLDSGFPSMISSELSIEPKMDVDASLSQPLPTQGSSHLDPTVTAQGLDPSSVSNRFQGISGLQGAHNTGDIINILDSSCALPFGTAKRKAFLCTMCDKSFSWKESLNTHIRNIHGSGQGPFPCPICGKLAKNKHTLSSHISIYHKQTNVNQ